MDDNWRLIVTAALAALPPTVGVIVGYLRTRARGEVIIKRVDDTHALVNQRYTDLMAMNTALQARLSVFEKDAAQAAGRAGALGDVGLLAAAAALISKAEIKAQELLAEAKVVAEHVKSEEKPR